MTIYRNLTALDGRYAACIGFFDGVHRGHRFLLEHLRAEAQRHGLLSAVVTFANHPRRLVRPDLPMPLIDTTDERLRKLEATGLDACFLLDFTPELQQMSACDFITDVLHRQLHIERLLIGYDHRFGRGRSEGFDDYVRYGAACGMAVVLEPELPDLEGCSSSEVRRLIALGDVAGAATRLGAPYQLTGSVVHGQQLGRQLGFPTANLQPDTADKLLPAAGVYAATATLGGSVATAETSGSADVLSYPTMVNIGSRPTVNSDASAVTIEAHLIGYEGDLYGQQLTLTFLRRIRDERRMASLDELRQQLTADCATFIET